MVVPVGGLDHAEWRQQGHPESAKNTEFCVDGDLVEMFLDMSNDVKEKIVEDVNKRMNTSYTVKGMSNYLQDIRTKHYYVYSIKQLQLIESIQRNQ